MQAAQPIDVIGYFGADGKMEPLRIRTEEPNGEIVHGYIREILRTKEENRLGIEARFYLCRAEMEGHSIVLELQYHIRRHCWLLVQKYR